MTSAVDGGNMASRTKISWTKTAHNIRICMYTHTRTHRYVDTGWALGQLKVSARGGLVIGHPQPPTHSNIPPRQPQLQRPVEVGLCLLRMSSGIIPTARHFCSRHFLQYARDSTVTSQVPLHRPVIFCSMKHLHLRSDEWTVTYRETFMKQF